MILVSYNWLHNFHRIRHDAISEPLSSHRQYIHILLHVVFLDYEYLPVTIYTNSRPKLADPYLAQCQADFQHCARCLRLLKWQAWPSVIDRRPSIEVLGATKNYHRSYTIFIAPLPDFFVGLNLVLWQGCMHAGSPVREPVKIRKLAHPVRERAKFVYRSEHIQYQYRQQIFRKFVFIEYELLLELFRTHYQ
jgi:hypothetical protein